MHLLQVEESGTGQSFGVYGYANDAKGFYSLRFWCKNSLSLEPSFTKLNKLKLTFVTDNRFSDRGFEFAYAEKQGQFHGHTWNA